MGKWDRGKNRQGSDDARRMVDQALHDKTAEALKRKNERFAEERKSHSRERLAAYIRAEAERLGKTPHVNEVIGGAFIAARFDGWDRAVRAAGLIPDRGKAPKDRGTAIYMEEFQHQVTRRRKSRENIEKLKLRKREEKHAARRQARREARAADAERDYAWGAAHESDSDEQLLAYLRRCAEELGHPPFRKEVLGGTYIKERFVCWAVALTRAGLPLPRGMQPPKAAEEQAYEASCAERGTKPASFRSE